MMAQAVDTTIGPQLQSEIRQRRSRAAIIGGAGLLLTILGAFIGPSGQFFRSYLWSYVFCVGLSLGCLSWLMLQYLTGGAWGVVIRRPAEAAARTLPLVAVLFIPVAVGIPNLYRWSHMNLIQNDPVMLHKHTYLNTPFFLIRALAYFA